MSITLKEFLSTASPEQAEVIEKIRNYGKREAELCNYINGMAEAVTSGRGYTSDGVSLIPCADEDDFRVWTGSQRTQLDTVRKQISGLFQRSVELGMGNLGFVQRNYEHYVGESIPN